MDGHYEIVMKKGMNTPNANGDVLPLEHEVYGNFIPNSPHLVLPPGAPSDFPDLLDYFQEKGLQVTDTTPHKGCIFVTLEGLKPKFFNQVVVPELKRRAVKWQKRITYRFKTKDKTTGSVSVHIDFWIKSNKAEVVRFPV